MINDLDMFGHIFVFLSTQSVGTAPEGSGVGTKSPLGGASHRRPHHQFSGTRPWQTARMPLPASVARCKDGAATKLPAGVSVASCRDATTAEWLTGVPPRPPIYWRALGDRFLQMLCREMLF